MAFAPAYAQQQAKGTLVSGQVISVNKYTVQIERFLSQGGFAHVYLVRTEQPVFNTTHHVLKRIAVANDTMLNEVRKEVDIMRILRGHPNIVYLIDAAWHRMSNGTFEVFILMEFCSGGGIIDMMNRRLRERLTESEILQIFVDVCEGVAAMHNLHPPLLHRDLKVENILQASQTSYKLCDFGSATPVSTRHPSTMPELRALENDLNRHTTLQYRSPEMVDVYLRRPIDEKADVWALGVLLYKLCYYTTPFEEHGILAILNVQYKFPPFPVYSHELNTLIASMLQEYGPQRPTVFELLDTVHKLRGTKSKFVYTPRRQQQPLSPHITQAPPLSSVQVNNQPLKPPGPLSPSSNGLSARERVLESIAPMRRGRPSSPTKSKAFDDQHRLLDLSDNNNWIAPKPAKAHKSGLATVSLSSAKSPSLASANYGSKDAWDLRGDTKVTTTPFLDTRTKSTNSFSDSFGPSLGNSTSVQHLSIKPSPSPATDGRPHSSSSIKSDAFESLSMFGSPRTQALTLGEQQKAAAQTSQRTSFNQSSHQNRSNGPSPSYTTKSPSRDVESLTATGSNSILKPRLSDTALSLTIEERFPSLQDLDSALLKAISTPSSNQSNSPEPSAPRLPPRPSIQDKPSTLAPSVLSGPSWRNGSGNGSVLTNQLRQEGVRSLQVTGTAMREARDRTKKGPSSSQKGSENILDDVSNQPKSGGPSPSLSNQKAELDIPSPTRPSLLRKNRSSVMIKGIRKADDIVELTFPVVSAREQPKDLLTGDDSFFLDTAIIRASPEKRTSVLYSPVPIDAAQEAIRSVRSNSPKKAIKRPSPISVVHPVKSEKASIEVSTPSTAVPEKISQQRDSSSDEGDEGPEEVTSSIRRSRSKVTKHSKGRQSSVHDLVDLWGGGVSSPNPKSPSKSTSNKRSSVIRAAHSASTVASPSKSASLDVHGSKFTRATTTGLKPPSDSEQSSHNNIRHHSPSPSSPSRTKTRPHSLLILPMQKSTSESSSSSARSPKLKPPEETSKPLGNRRSSISEMVSRYEAIENKAVSGAPAPAAKPARLRVASSSMSSPTAASLRFPRISPTTSPTKSTVMSEKLTLPEPTKSQPIWRRSPSPINGENEEGNNRASPLHTPERENAPRSPIFARSAALQASSERMPLTSLKTSSSRELDEPRSPSPERPFEGVSKLINQWQKKAEEANKEGFPNYRGGSRFRREVTAGGMKNS